MISIDKLKIFPFRTNQLAIPQRKGDPEYNLIYFPENTSFFKSYYKLNIKRMHVRKGTLVPSRFPKLIITGKQFAAYRSLKILPAPKPQKVIGNLYTDTSLYLDTLDSRFKKGSYRRPIVSRSVMGYLTSIKEYVPGRKQVLLYHVDMDSEFPEDIQYRRIFPILLAIRKSRGESPFDYILLAMSSGGSTVYSALQTTDKVLPFGRLYAIFKSLKPRKPEEIEDTQQRKREDATTKIVDIVGEKPQNEEKLKDSVGGYLQASNPLKADRIVDIKDLSKTSVDDLVMKSILYNISGDKDKSEEIANHISPENKTTAANAIRKDLLPEIVERDVYKNKSRDSVFEKVDTTAINGNKEPSRVLNKRKVDFQVTFEKDIVNVFRSLSKKDNFPLKIKGMKKEKVPIEPGNLNPSLYIKYTFTLVGENGKEHIVEIAVPEIQDDGTIMIYGKKKYLIYQIILDPIFFIKPGQAKLQTLYSTVSVHHKKTSHKSHYEINIAGFYHVPLFLLLAYHIGFKSVCNLFNIKYKVVSEQPPGGTYYLPLTGKEYLWFTYTGESAKRLLNSLLEVKYPFSSVNIELKETFEKAIISMTKNRNSIHKINKVLENIMEPVSVQVLKSKLLPYDFTGCIKYICDELAKGRVDKRNDLTKQRVRSSEIFAHQIIKSIQSSFSEYESKRTVGDDEAEFKVDTIKVISDTVTKSPLVREFENINPIEELSSMTRTTPSGIGGISDTRAVAEKDRNIDESYYGNIDPMDTPEGGNIGVINQLTVDSTINNARGSFKSKYGIDDKSGILSPTAAMIPYVGSCDGSRVMLASSQAKQALPINGKEQPLVQTGYETIMASMLSDSYIKKAPVDGVILKVTENVIYVKDKNGKVHPVPNDAKKLNSLQGQSSINYFTPTIRVGQKVKKGQIVSEGKHMQDGVISVGTNLLVGIMGWKGYSYEDGYIVSDRIADRKLSSVSYDERTLFVGKADVIKSIVEEGKETIKGEPLLLRTSKEVEILSGAEEDELVEGQVITKSPGGKVVAIEVYPNTSLKQFPALEKPFEIFKKRYEETKGPLPPKFFEIRSGRKEFFQGIKIVFKIERVETTIVGDKLANNHGGKGVITLVEKFENMPITPWGQPLDIMLNPLAIINRMNPSTIFEMYTGLIAKALAYKIAELDRVSALKLITDIYVTLDKTKNQKLSKQIISGFTSMSDTKYKAYQNKLKENGYILPIIIPQFQSPNKDDIRKALAIVGAAPSYHLKLPEYKTKTKNKVACGYLYYKKLEAQAEGKISARSVGRYHGKTLQPVAGKKAGGGQRLGEFDTWALIDHGCTDILKEMFGPLSDDQRTKDEIISEIIQTGEAGYREPKSSPTKELLDTYIRGMMLETSIEG